MTELIKQMALPIFDFSDIVERFAQGASEERGAVFTRNEVVEFILDLAGYTIDRDLYHCRLLEPSFGNGDFLLPAADRLLTSYETHVSGFSSIVKDLSGAIRAVELHQESIENTRAGLLSLFREHGISDEDTHQIVNEWILKGDFLLIDLPWLFTYAVGNPPYIRQESIPNDLITEYRLRYSTIYDRADLYVPFIERCLMNLEPFGTLGFICADRWMKNKYGRLLRKMISGKYHLAYYVDMVDTPAFHSDVIAYPAITIIKSEKPGSTRIARRPKIEKETLAELTRVMHADSVPENSGVVEVKSIVQGGEPWILQSFDQLAVVRRLEENFPLLEDAGCKVGIGVATGADKVFIGYFDSLDVEVDRKLPLVGTKDIEGGTVQWKGMGVINPFRDDGYLVNLSDYPRLEQYLKQHSETILRRNCARNNPTSWYRTIDRIYPELVKRPKLLIPDIKGEALVVYEDGHFYPHHNLYYIISDSWDLKALQAILRSGIAKLFVSIYSTQMRGGYFRFQAQYLRRIRLPKWEEVPGIVRDALVKAANAGDVDACNQAVFDLYQFKPDERDMISCYGKQGV